nr:MAG TPA: hypothetical protein [Caudoviricetes sp.]
MCPFSVWLAPNLIAPGRNASDRKGRFFVAFFGSRAEGLRDKRDCLIHDSPL